MIKAEIIASLKDQAKDKDSLANGEMDSIFTRDAQALREAAEMLEKSEVKKYSWWEPVHESELTGWNPELAGRDPIATHQCHKCKTEVFYNHDDKPIFSEYCPHCGARMDGGKDDAQE